MSRNSSGTRRVAISAVAVLAAAMATAISITFANGSSASDDPRSSAVAAWLGVPAVHTGGWSTVDVQGAARAETIVDGVGLVQVDPDTLEVQEVIWDARLVRTSPAVATRDSAVRTASEFAAAHYAGFGGLTPRGAELIDHGTFREYRVTWQERAGDAWLPSQVAIGVNADSGEVAYYWSDRRPVTIGTTPVVDATTAVARARAATGRLTEGRVDSNELTVLDDHGQQRLVWVVRLSGAPSVGNGLVMPRVDVVQVDALSGAAEVTTR